MEQSLILTPSQATARVNAGGEAYAVMKHGVRIGIRGDYDVAEEFANATEADYILDWETGNYA